MSRLRPSSVGSTLRAWPAPTTRRVRPAAAAESIVTHAEESISEDAIVAAARERAVDIGAGAVTPAVGALLCVLAKLTGAKAVVEVGTGAGVSGLWLLSGMREDGVLTTIDVEPEHQRMAKQAFTEAGIGPVADPVDLRPRAGGAHPARRRVLRPGVHRRATRPTSRSSSSRACGCCGPAARSSCTARRSAGVPATPTANDAEVSAVREAARLIAEDERLTPVLVPLGDGLLAAARD